MSCARPVMLCARTTRPDTWSVPNRTAQGNKSFEHMLATAASAGVPLQRDNDNAWALRRSANPRRTRNRDPVRPTTPVHRPD